MDERNILKKIAESAQDVQVPDALGPSQMKKRLDDSRIRKRRRYKNAAAAACLCLCFGAAGLAFGTGSRTDSYQAGAGSAMGSKADIAANANDKADAADDADRTVRDTGTDMPGTPAADAESYEEKEPPLKKIGKMYTLASDYGDVYDVLKKTEVQETWYRDRELVKMEGVQDAEDSIFNERNDLGNANAKAEKQAAADNADYSGTNLRVAGVDESDIVKTDGKYIYVVQDAKIQVLDVRNKAPEQAGTIVPDMKEDTDQIREMYVSDQMLTLIIQSEKSALQQEAGDANGDAADKSSGVDIKIPEESEDLAVAEKDIYYFNTDPLTKVMTYDISNPAKAFLKGTTTQDGWYQDSRKIENRLYLFTNRTMYLEQRDSRKTAVMEDAVNRWIPCVNDKAVSADCIYLPKEGNEGLLMCSVDLAQNHKILDMKLLINHYAQFYVTGSSAYLYYTDYVNGTDKTRIARFLLDTDGTIRAKAAATLKGSIEDTFAIHERNGYLQVLTSVMNTDPWENRVYVLDENMETVGKLTGLAEGERIYAARFAGSIGYFVTYRNTDPLFTVDFSNPREPKVIGELKVTGFSDYLHFWNDNRLLGIGQETDPENGNVIGIKLSMFDISDPANVEEAGRIVLQDADDCEAMYNYKAVLADADKNIIALTTQSWGNAQHGYQKDYRVFSYTGGEFETQLKRSLAAAGKEYDESRWRSLYIGNVLYLVSEKKAIAFDMEDGFKEIGKVKYAE